MDLHSKYYQFDLDSHNLKEISHMHYANTVGDKETMAVINSMFIVCKSRNPSTGEMQYEYFKSNIDIVKFVQFTQGGYIYKRPRIESLTKKLILTVNMRDLTKLSDENSATLAGWIRSYIGTKKARLVTRTTGETEVTSTSHDEDSISNEEYEFYNNGVCEEDDDEEDENSDSEEVERPANVRREFIEADGNDIQLPNIFDNATQTASVATNPTETASSNTFGIAATASTTTTSSNTTTTTSVPNETAHASNNLPNLYSVPLAPSLRNLPSALADANNRKMPEFHFSDSSDSDNDSWPFDDIEEVHGDDFGDENELADIIRAENQAAAEEAAAQDTVDEESRSANDHDEERSEYETDNDNDNESITDPDQDGPPYLGALHFPYTLEIPRILHRMPVYNVRVLSPKHVIEKQTYVIMDKREITKIMSHSPIFHLLRVEMNLFEVMEMENLKNPTLYIEYQSALSLNYHKFADHAHHHAHPTFDHPPHHPQFVCVDCLVPFITYHELELHREIHNFHFNLNYGVPPCPNFPHT